MYEDDTPAAERRMQALTLDRDLLRELLGADELRDLLDPDALELGRARPGRGSGARRRTACTTCCAASGDLTRGELADRGDDVEAAAEQLRRASAARCASGSRARTG